MPNLNIETTVLLGGEIERLADIITERTRIVFFETPTNPNMEVIDIAAAVWVAKARGALTVVDNTFASPVKQSSLQLGADLAVHSTTKYLGGHSDLTGGGVVGAQSLVAPVWPWRKNLGQMMAPEAAFLLARSLRTLTVRVRQQNVNAQAVADFLSTHPKTKRVNYPGLASFAGHDVARKQMHGVGSCLRQPLAGAEHA